MPRIGGVQVGFWGAVVGVWTALRLKKEYDEYREVASEDAAEDGRIRLPVTPLPDGAVAESEDAVSLLNNGSRRRDKKKPSGCCVCCGVDCTLFWKAFGLVAGLWALYAIFSGLKWALSPSPTGLENLPEWGTSLTCTSKNFFYKDAPEGFEYTVPVSDEFHDHSLKLRGSGMGTLTITNAPMGVNEVTYKIVLHGSDKATVDTSKFEIERPDEGLGVALRFDTPSIPLSEVGNCIRFDITMAVPSSVKILNVHAKSLLQVKFADDAAFDLKKLSMVHFISNDKNVMHLSKKVFADSIDLEVFRGWIVGDVTVTKSTNIVTQRADGVANVKVYPAAPEDPLNPETALLQTTTGTGRTDVFYISDPMKRPIQSKHLSSMGGNVYLDYKKARFSGKVAMNAKSYSMSNVHSIAGPGKDTSSGDVLRRQAEWTHYIGDMNGKDTMEVMSIAGWVGLYV